MTGCVYDLICEDEGNEEEDGEDDGGLTWNSSLSAVTQICLPGGSGGGTLG